MELIGQALAYREESEGLRLLFRCTNKEEFDLKCPSALRHIPPDVIVRVWTKRPMGERGMPSRTNVLTHWEDL